MDAEKADIASVPVLHYRRSVLVDLNFPLLLQRAQRAAELAEDDPTFGLDGVLFSAIAAEAFPNDLSQMLQIFAKCGTLPEPLAAARDLLPEFEQQKLQIRSKYQMLFYVLRGQSLNLGELPYQDFDLLITLRNELVHPKAGLVRRDQDGAIYEASVRRLLDRLKQRGLLDERFAKFERPWRNQLESRAAAIWALSAVSRIVTLICDSIPESRTRRDYTDDLRLKLQKYIQA